MRSHLVFARSSNYGGATTHRVGEVKVLHFMMNGENQQKRCIGCAEHVTAAECHGMRENHPVLPGMNSIPLLCAGAIKRSARFRHSAQAK